MADARGDDTQAMALLQECLTITREMGDLDMLGFSLLKLARMVMRRDDTEAERLVQEGLMFAREIGDQAGISHGPYLLGEIARIRGDTEQAAEYYRESLTLALERKSPGITGLEMKVIIGWCLLGGARVASKRGAFRRATRFLGAAETQLNIRRDLNPAEQAEYECDVADLRAKLGEADFSLARNEGYTMTSQQALTTMESPITREHLIEPNPQTIQSTRSSPPKAPGYPAGLTTREVEVLRLVANGLTVIQVAEQLVVSPRTVSTHLTSIYNKLGVNSRSAATRFAVEHGLV